MCYPTELIKMTEKNIITPMKIINDILRRMDWGGYNPRNRTKSKIFISSLGLLWIFCGIILQTVFLITTEYTDLGNDLVDNIMLVGFCEVEMKQYCLLVKHRTLKMLINMIEKEFWNLNVVQTSKKDKLQTIYNITNFISNGMFAFSIVITFGYVFVVYIRGDEILPYNIWMPSFMKEYNRSYPGHQIIFGIESVIIAAVVLFALIQNDCLFIVLIVLGVVQFKILKNSFRKLDENVDVQDCLQKIANCVKHHNLLFNFFNGLEDIFSTQLLISAATNVVIAVVFMYSSLVEVYLSRIIIYDVFVIYCTIRLFIPCYLGQLIHDESLSVADAVYFSDWENIPNKNVRLSLLLIILRSQQSVDITFGKLYILSLETFTQMSKFMFSILTLMLNFSVDKH